MVEVKQIQTFNYENDYKNNIQLQFSDDQKFNAFIQMLCDYVNEFQETLISYNNLFNLNNATTYNFVLNAIGQILGLPPIGYFGNITPQQYITLINGQQIKNSYNGTNASLLNLLNTLLPQYGWVIQDTGDMTLGVYLNTKNTKYFDATPTIVESSTITQINIDKSKYQYAVNKNTTYYYSYDGNGMWSTCSLVYPGPSWLCVYPPNFNAKQNGITFVGEPQAGDRISITISNIADIDPFVEQIFEEGYLTPKPAGVSLTYNILTETYFAWDIEDDTTTPKTAGWDTGVWL